MNAEEYVVSRLIEAEQTALELRACIGEYEETISKKTREIEELESSLEDVRGFIEEGISVSKFGYSLSIYSDKVIKMIAETIGIELPTYSEDEDGR